jgi:hypothetical protein
VNTKQKIPFFQTLPRTLAKPKALVDTAHHSVRLRKRQVSEYSQALFVVISTILQDMS